MLVLRRKKEEAVLVKINGLTLRILVTDFKNSDSPNVALGFDGPQDFTIVREEIDNGSCNSTK